MSEQSNFPKLPEPVKQVYVAGDHDGGLRDALEDYFTAEQMAAYADAAYRDGYAPKEGEVTVTVSGLTGSGKSAVCGEIEILCRALSLEVEWIGSESEKRLTHADWTEALELYKPRVVIREVNEPRMTATRISGSE